MPLRAMAFPREVTNPFPLVTGAKGRETISQMFPSHKMPPCMRPLAAKRTSITKGAAPSSAPFVFSWNAEIPILNSVCLKKIDPLSRTCAFEDHVADVLRTHRLPHIRFVVASLIHGSEEVGKTVDERVFVADRCSGNPVVPHVRMLGVSDVNVLPSNDMIRGLFSRFRVTVAEELKTVRTLQIEVDGTVFAVQLKRIVVLASACIARTVERTERPIFEDRDERTGIIDGDGFHLAGLGVHSFLDEDLGFRRHAGDRTIEPLCQVDRVSQKDKGV